MHTILKYLKVWVIFAINSFQVQMNVRWALLLFLFGKVLRFSIFLFFIVILVNTTKSLAGYTLDQTILFFLTFNLIDTLAQVLFREVYRFRPMILSGNFDFYLIKPINALFRSLTAGPDLLDFFTLIPLVGAIYYFLNRLNLITFENMFIYVLLVFSGFVIALSFHILVLCLAILTTEIDHAVMLYRDITSLGRMPINIYSEPLRGLLTFVIPVGIMMSFPVQAILGQLNPYDIIYAVSFSLILFVLSIRLWIYSVKKYTSASS